MNGPAAADEAIIDPGRIIIDAHHHLMVRPGHRYLLDEYLADIASGHDVRASVYIESRAMCRADGPEPLRPVGETEFANGIAAMAASGTFGPCRVAAAIVGYADLSLGSAAGAVLDAHATAGGGRFRGIRQGSYWDADEAVWRHVSMRPPPGLLGEAAFRAGFAELARRGLAFEAVLFHPQIPELTALAAAFPDTPVILDHLGFPLGIGRYAADRRGVFETWRQAMADLARCENVRVKVGGFGIPVWGFDYQKGTDPVGSAILAEAWRPWFETAVALFGPRRLMFESNFPPDRRNASYVSVWNALKRLTAGFGEAERDRLFHGTAAETYRIVIASREGAASNGNGSDE